MSEQNGKHGLALKGDHPGFGGLESADGSQAKDLAEIALPDPLEGGGLRAVVSAGEASLSVLFEAPLVGAFSKARLDPKNLLDEALRAVPDGEKIATGLAAQDVTLLLLIRAKRAIVPSTGDKRVGVHRALFRVTDPILRRILLQMGMVHALRSVAVAGGVESPDALQKKDAGLFLKLLTGHHRRVFYLPRVLRDIDGIIDPACGFRDILVPILSKLPFVQAEDPAESPYGKPFLDGRAFDALGFGAKLRLLLGGLLAWYTVLTLGLLGLFKPIWNRLTPFYVPALNMLRNSFDEQYLVKRGFMGRGVKALLRGNFPGAVEYFWSAWNPVLARSAVRPMYRLLGGNRRPLIATPLTFLYTAWIVHPLWAAGAALLAFRLGYENDPGFTIGGHVGSNTNFAVLFGAVGAWTFFGLVSGISKALRKRRHSMNP